MSAEKSRQTQLAAPNIVAISAVVRAYVRRARGRTLGAVIHIGAAPGYLSGGSSEAQGVWTR
jgi:hypothetical protein